MPYEKKPFVRYKEKVYRNDNTKIVTNTNQKEITKMIESRIHAYQVSLKELRELRTKSYDIEAHREEYLHQHEALNMDILDDSIMIADFKVSSSGTYYDKKINALDSCLKDMRYILKTLWDIFTKDDFGYNK